MSKTASLLLKESRFEAIKKAVQMSDREILDEILDASLLGRGGASYPTGKKWEQLYKIEGNPKYIVCNCDEGEPGTFKDRELISKVPLRVIEGMLIAGYLFKSNRGIIYIRGEYRKFVDAFKQAIEHAVKAGYLGENIMGIKGFNFTMTVVTGAGAYVCGENSALLNSIESKVSRPRIKPPHLAEVGLYGKPTLVNNVESYACVSVIFEMGAQEFKSYGTSLDGGTKLISLSAHSKNRGTYEVCLGTTLKDIIYDEELGGGIRDNKKLKFYHLGGQSGPLGFPEQLETKYCYEDLKEAGLAIGSGAVVVLDESVCIVEYVKRVMEFFVDESCGKCTPCRIGTTRLLEMLEKFTNGTAVVEDLDNLVQLGNHVTRLSLCGLGQASCKALMSALKYRKEEFVEHINGKCPVGSCSMNGEAE